MNTKTLSKIVSRKQTDAICIYREFKKYFLRTGQNTIKRYFSKINLLLDSVIEISLYNVETVTIDRSNQRDTHPSWRIGEKGGVATRRVAKCKRVKKTRDGGDVGASVLLWIVKRECLKERRNSLCCVDGGPRWWKAGPVVV